MQLALFVALAMAALGRSNAVIASAESDQIELLTNTASLYPSDDFITSESRGRILRSRNVASSPVAVGKTRAAGQWGRAHSKSTAKPRARSKKLRGKKTEPTLTNVQRPPVHEVSSSTQPAPKGEEQKDKTTIDDVPRLVSDEAALNAAPAPNVETAPKDEEQKDKPLFGVVQHPPFDDTPSDAEPAPEGEDPKNQPTLDDVERTSFEDTAPKSETALEEDKGPTNQPTLDDVDHTTFEDTDPNAERALEEDKGPTNQPAFDDVQPQTFDHADPNAETALKDEPAHEVEDRRSKPALEDAQHPAIDQAAPISKPPSKLKRYGHMVKKMIRKIM